MCGYSLIWKIFLQINKIFKTGYKKSDKYEVSQGISSHDDPTNTHNSWS